MHFSSIFNYLCRLLHRVLFLIVGVIATLIVTFLFTSESASSARPVRSKTLDLFNKLSVSVSSLPAGEEGGSEGQRSPHPWSSVKAKSLDYSGDEMGTPSVQGE